MKAQIRRVQDGDKNYECLAFMCPGCMAGESMGSGLHMLPVNTPLVTSWTFDGNVEAPTLAPSILSRTGNEAQHICHGYLEGGKWRFLSDSTHPLAGKEGIEMPDLPDWVTHEETGESL